MEWVGWVGWDDDGLGGTNGWCWSWAGFDLLFAVIEKGQLAFFLGYHHCETLWGKRE